jgi:hypothetical protein
VTASPPAYLANSHPRSRRPIFSQGGNPRQLGYVRTARRGPDSVATYEEVVEVLALAEEGCSLREIAERVWGSRRLKDRAARVLRSTRPKTKWEHETDREIESALARIIADGG